jgi:4-hydroxybenzoate polyprenyltransferase
MSPASGTRAAPRRGFSPGSTAPVLLLRAAHPRQAVLTALLMAGAALMAGRELREVGLVALTVLVGQAMLGWDNDLVDRTRDRRHDLPGKPVAQGLLEPGTVWFTLTCALLLVVPLSVAHGRIAAGAYLLSLLVALVGNRVGRRTVLSFLPWVLGFALWPAFLAYGGWGGVGSDTPPSVVMTVLAGLLGLGVHVLRSLPGLVPDNADGWRSLPLRLALRTGAPRLLVIAGVYTALVGAAILIAGQSVGLT